MIVAVLRHATNNTGNGTVMINAKPVIVAREKSVTGYPDAMSMHSISTAILVGHWLIVIGLSLRVISLRSPVGVASAWLVILFSVPLVGAILYLLFGEKRLGRARAARTKAHVPGLQAWQRGLSHASVDSIAAMPVAGALANLAQGLYGFPPQPGQSVTLLDNYPAIFDAIVADIDRARARCHLAFYIWHGEGRTLDVVEALVRAAQRGVKCRAMADALGSKAFLQGPHLQRLREAGVQFEISLPMGRIPSLRSRADLRNHRKIVVIDEDVAYTGSQNLVDPRFFKQESGAGQWVDAMARISGPAVSSLDGVFELDWSVETGKPFEAPEPALVDPAEKSGMILQVVPSGPDLQPEGIHQLLLTAIYNARSEIVMTTPYFVPDESFILALQAAVQRGARVTLIVPAHNDSVLVRHASVASFDTLMEAGVNIALFKGGLLHTKSMAIDGQISLFGSVNFDMRSLWLNFEISLLVYDAEFCSRLRVLQNSYLDDSEILTLAEWRRRPRWRKFVEDAFRLLGPVL